MQEMKFNRQNLLERDEYKCQYCSKNFPPKDLNMDHAIPVTAGEARLGERRHFMHRCNSKKSNRLPQEAGMRLLKQPKRPPVDPS